MVEKLCFFLENLIFVDLRKNQFFRQNFPPNFMKLSSSNLFRSHKYNLRPNFVFELIGVIILAKVFDYTLDTRL